MPFSWLHEIEICASSLPLSPDTAALTLNPTQRCRVGDGVTMSKILRLHDAARRGLK